MLYADWTRSGNSILGKHLDRVTFPRGITQGALDRDDFYRCAQQLFIHLSKFPDSSVQASRGSFEDNSLLPRDLLARSSKQKRSEGAIISLGNVETDTFAKIAANETAKRVDRRAKKKKKERKRRKSVVSTVETRANVATQ